MRTTAAALGLLIALGVAGCGSDSGGRSTTPLVPASSGATGSGSGSASSGETACDEVRAGIDAFNAGDFAQTVRDFEKAVPLATDEDAAKQTRASADLLEAVEYYAKLPAEDYLDASADSPDFAKYKAITLDQCEGPDNAPPPSGDGGGGTNI